MRLYGKLTKGETADPFFFQFEGCYLYFYLAWFFVFAFILFLLTVQLYRLGEKLFKKQEYKRILLVIVTDLVIAFGLLYVFPWTRYTVLEEIVQVENPEFPDWDEITEMQSLRFAEQDARFPFLQGTNPRMFPPRPFVTEHLFVLITVILSVLLMRLLSNRQDMELAIEKLKTEKLQTSYNALMGQINPHFFFNSLNGLNSLIRRGEEEHTLKYLDELSNVFRYILQSNKKELVTLAEELQFVKAYTYLLSVRYEGKLFFSIQANPSSLLLYLPILSVLPLVENAVKHNVISKQYPLRVDIYTNQDNMLVVSNKIQPKVEEPGSSGIGLQNLWGRYHMLTGKNLQISNNKGYFKVSLPLLNSGNKS